MSAGRLSLLVGELTTFDRSTGSIVCWKWYTFRPLISVSSTKSMSFVARAFKSK
ncbi:Uncharacterised protein [Mycobacteroides abscessus subsp. abscessus]|nr:Uncharacterised protein [Mycobacteroides abscessus subsp. abscessus]